MTTKKCITCDKEDEIIIGFYKQRLKKDGTYTYSSYCKECDRAKAKLIKIKNRSKYLAKRRKKRSEDPEYAEHVRAQKRRSNLNNLESGLLHRAKQRALKNNLEFTITIEDIIIPKVCPILEVPFILGKKGDYTYTPSLDRIDTTKGYIKGNVMVITMLANSMKNSASFKELKTFAKNILPYINN